MSNTEAIRQHLSSIEYELSRWEREDGRMDPRCACLMGHFVRLNIALESVLKRAGEVPFADQARVVQEPQA